MKGESMSYYRSRDSPGILMTFWSYGPRQKAASKEIIYHKYHETNQIRKKKGREKIPVMVNELAFFSSAVGVLQTLVIALGAGLGIWGVINLMEGYGNDNPGANAHVP